MPFSMSSACPACLELCREEPSRRVLKRSAVAVAEGRRLPRKGVLGVLPVLSLPAVSTVDPIEGCVSAVSTVAAGWGPKKRRSPWSP
jgi:hypothetical protein